MWLPKLRNDQLPIKKPWVSPKYFWGYTKINNNNRKSNIHTNYEYYYYCIKFTILILSNKYLISAIPSSGSIDYQGEYIKNRYIKKEILLILPCICCVCYSTLVFISALILHLFLTSHPLLCALLCPLICFWPFASFVQWNFSKHDMS